MTSGIKITKAGMDGGDTHKGRHLVSIPPSLMPELKAYKDKLEQEVGMPLTFGQVIVYLINREKKANV